VRVLDEVVQHDHTVPDKGTRASAQHLYYLGRKSGGAFPVELRVLHSKIRLLAARVCEQVCVLRARQLSGFPVALSIRCINVGRTAAWARDIGLSARVTTGDSPRLICVTTHMPPTMPPTSSMKTTTSTMPSPGRFSR
jgi:hypothetical protein